MYIHHVYTSCIYIMYIHNVCTSYIYIYDFEIKCTSYFSRYISFDFNSGTELKIFFQDVVFPPSWANVYITFHNICGSGYGLRTTTCHKKLVDIGKGMFPVKKFSLCQLNYMENTTMSLR